MNSRTRAIALAAALRRLGAVRGGALKLTV